MAGTTQNGGRWRGSAWRTGIWVAAGSMLLMPLLAMQFTDEVAWDAADFTVFGAMLLVACGAFELSARMTANGVYRTAVGVALAAAFLLVWMNLAVGIIGTEDNPANLMFGVVLAVGIVGAAIARLQPSGMTRALIATALAQALVAVVAAVGGMGHPASPPLEILGVNALFVALWLASAWLFWGSRAASKHGWRGRAD